MVGDADGDGGGDGDDDADGDADGDDDGDADGDGDGLNAINLIKKTSGSLLYESNPPAMKEEILQQNNWREWWKD